MNFMVNWSYQCELMVFDIDRNNINHMKTQIYIASLCVKGVSIYIHIYFLALPLRKPGSSDTVVMS